MSVYHEVTDTPSEFQRLSQGFTTPDELGRHMDWISSRFEFIAPVDLPQLGAGGPLPERAALITFDDAWAGTFRKGLPILASRGIPALCFINMATVHRRPRPQRRPGLRAPARDQSSPGCNRSTQPRRASWCPR